MNTLLYIIWNTDPAIFSLGPLTIRYYGLLFALAFLAGYSIMQWFLKREDEPKEWMDSILIYVMVGTVLGARLGHVFFYQWDYYQHHLLEIPMIWEGGLASHGAAIGIIISLFLWSRKVSKKPLLWSLDRVVITVALASMFIRVGNFMNHEIVGKPTETESGVKFIRNTDDVGYFELQQITAVEFVDENNEIIPAKLNEAYDKLVNDMQYDEVLQQVPNRHPAQLYEAVAYAILFMILLALYSFTDARLKSGLIFGIFLIYTFTARFFLEYFKEVQVSFEEGMALDMGQWLSIPFVAAGLFFLVRALIRPKTPLKNA